MAARADVVASHSEQLLSTSHRIVSGINRCEFSFQALEDRSVGRAIGLHTCGADEQKALKNLLVDRLSVFPSEMPTVKGLRVNHWIRTLGD